MFPAELWQSQIDIDNNKLSKFILDLETNTESAKISNIGGWQSDANFIFLSELDELRNKITSLLSEVSKVNAYKDDVSFLFSNGWANINRFKDYNTNHQHPLSHWSGVYYVSAPENSGNIHFFDPKVSRSMVPELPYVKNLDNPSQATYLALKPKEGRFILFPSYIEHSVGPNLSDQPRISISVNFNLKKNK